MQFIQFFLFNFGPECLALAKTGLKSNHDSDHELLILTEHCDGTYMTPDSRERTFYTLHLYLNDSLNGKVGGEPTREEGPAPFPELLIKGGATTFWSNDLQRRLEVHPKAGRVLIFQHRGLLHSGGEVHEGIKYTMRSDLLFEMDRNGKLDEP
jgi:hypothetical protein